MALLDSIYNSFEYNLYDEYNTVEYDEILLKINENISMLRLYMSDTLSNNRIYDVDSKPDYKYKTDCTFHFSYDKSLVISEEKKAWFCYGCGNGGKVIDYVMSKYNCTPEESINILLAFINNTSNLSPREKEIYEKLFSHYYDKKIDEYIKKSEEKTIYLNDRIKRYISRYESVDDINKDILKISNRLSCSKKYVKKVVYQVQR